MNDMMGLQNTENGNDNPNSRSSQQAMIMKELMEIFSNLVSKSD